MKFKVSRRGIEIIPENDQDTAYIEDTLGLKRDGDAIPLVRQNAIGLGCMGNLTTHPFPRKELRIVGSPSYVTDDAPTEGVFTRGEGPGQVCAQQEGNCKSANCPTHGSLFPR